MSGRPTLMSRIPPGLLYLTIYNPTLRPNSTVPPDDEDAEEQAHIIFYTGRDRAVSRDRILREVGLAKALINFARYVSPSASMVGDFMYVVSMFNAEDTCESTHSQSRRMIMVSPEPNFWIHAVSNLAQSQSCGRRD